MAFTHWIVLALLQAFAEVLPIGAAAHFAFLHVWTDIPAAGASGSDVPELAVGIRLGLAIGTAAYFWQDIADIAQGLIRLAKGKRDTGGKLGFQLVFATLPSIAVALAIYKIWGTDWQTPMVTAWATVAIACLLFLFDHTSMTVKRVEHAGYGDAFLLGCAEAIAFIPGVGRIAVAITVARLLGYERRDAARFAFLISIPVVIASVAWNAWFIVAAHQPLQTMPFVVGFAVAFLTTLVLLAMLTGWLRRRSFAPFAIYRLLIGANLLAVVYGLL